MTTSRNKREGRYAGKWEGRHIRLSYYKLRSQHESMVEAQQWIDYLNEADTLLESNLYDYFTSNNGFSIEDARQRFMQRAEKTIGDNNGE